MLKYKAEKHLFFFILVTKKYLGLDEGHLHLLRFAIIPQSMLVFVLLVFVLSME